jgi:hypothetical protein
MEAFLHVLAQLGDLTRTPADLATPEYMVMRKFKRYEIRRRGVQFEPDLHATRDAKTQVHA